MKKLALVPMIGLILSGCGGSGSDNSQPQLDVAPKAVLGTIDSVDAISKQIVVNGYRYDVASVAYGANPLAVTDLKANMMVQVASAAKSGVQVQVEPTIVGMITGIVGNTFKVNGISLTFDGLHADIDNGDWVMVSSLPTATAGYKVLSVVEFEADKLGNTVEVEGRLSGLDNNNNTFKLGAALTVNYTQQVVEDNATLLNGQWVEVTGSINGTTLDATEVEVDDYDDLGDDNEVEGVITWVANDQSAFELSFRGRFVVNNGTEFDDGNKTNLKQGVVVEVKSVTQNGQQIATEVEFDDDYTTGPGWKEVEAEGIATVIDADAATFSVLDAQTGNTVNFVTDSQTVFEGVNMATLGGSRVEAEAVVINGKNVAREVELDND
ncbi:DUF5666 domain-containing protein [Photobacterium nomapromontoriensis]|uniref:DUF5666 domain-containing protein n=1 Tax=Photobacterium nomapromontoriensis TaxID=2910237 RepID=UPI003D0F2F27